MIRICIFVIHQNLIIMSKPILVISNDRLVSLYMSLYGISFLPPSFRFPTPEMISSIRYLVALRLDELSRVDPSKSSSYETDRA